MPFLNTDVWSKELLWTLTKSGQMQPENTPEKVGPTAPKGSSLLTTQAHGLCHRTERAQELDLGIWTRSVSLPHHRLGFRPSWDKMGSVASG